MLLSDIILYYTKKYLKEHNMKQKDFAKMVGISQSQLSIFLNKNNYMYTSAGTRIRLFIMPEILRQEKQENYNKYGYELTNEDVKKIKLVYKKIIENIGENKLYIKDYLYDWNNKDGAVEFIRNNGINIEAETYSKSGLYTDTDSSSSIKLKWENIDKLKESVKVFYKN